MRDIGAAKPALPLAAREPYGHISPRLIHQIDEALGRAGPFGEVRLVMVRGRLRFIQVVSSESVDEKDLGT